MEHGQGDLGSWAGPGEGTSSWGSAMSLGEGSSSFGKRTMVTSSASGEKYSSWLSGGPAEGSAFNGPCPHTEGCLRKRKVGIPG